MTIGDFPGFNSVVLSHSMLRTLARECPSSWRTALSNVSGVYLITDEILSNLVFWESDLGGKFFYSVDETDTFDDVRYDL
jgi:hypothetical protein